MDNNNYNNNNNKTNTMAILGFVFSFLFSIVGLILSIVALKQIKETNEKGKGFAIAGLVISIIKSVLIILIALCGVLFTNLIWGSLRDGIIDSARCSAAKECTYDETSGNYNCILYDEDGEEQSIICDEDSISDFKDKSTYYSDYKDDEDFEDPFDYDREY